MRLCGLLVCLAGGLSAQEVERLDGKRLIPAAIDQVVESHMRAGRVTGLALAVLNRKELA